MLLSYNINFAQEFNGYKYILIPNLDYGAKGKDIYGIGSGLVSYFETKGYEVIFGWEEELLPSELKFNVCLGLYVSFSHLPYPHEVTLDFGNCTGEKFKDLKGKGGNYKKALEKIFNELDKKGVYSFNKNLTPTIEYPIVENINKDETQLKVYFDSTKLDPIEGIYKTYKSGSHYKLGIVKVGDKFKAIIIESDYVQWKKGDVKAVFESTAAEGVFSTKWYMGDKTSKETFANLEGGLINVEFENPNRENDDIKLLKLYPKN
jgi:uncharacterized protein YodC (DUF2158 family)